LKPASKQSFDDTNPRNQEQLKYLLFFAVLQRTFIAFE